MNKDEIIDKLKKENAYLKSLLEQNKIAYEQPKEIKQFSFSDDEKIALYLSYFVGRDDIFAYEYYTKENKRMFSPACKARANLTGYCPNKCSECLNKQYVGLTQREIRRHLIGTDTFGIYPLLKGDTCQLLAVDFDDDDYKESAKEFSKICTRHNLDNLVEISSSGCGAHVWLFFEKAVKASKARRLGTYLIYEAMDSSKGIDFNSLDRMFPSQDFVPLRGFGNLIVLPLQGKKALEGRTLFVDENLVPYDLKDQINVLANTKKITEEEIDALLNAFKEADYFPLLNKNILKNIKLNRTDFAKQIVIIKQNEIVVPKAALNDRSVKFICRLASLPNPKYYEAQKNRISTYNIHRIQQLYYEDESFVYLPRGCFEDLIKTLNFFNVETTLIDKQTSGEMIMVSFNGVLKDYQRDGLNQLMKYDNGLFVARPSYGKTVTAIALIAELKLNTLVIVPNLTLLNQWKERLNQFLDVGYDYKKEKDKFGTYSGNKKKVTNKIDVACIDSLLKEEGEELLKNYGLTILDEVHHIAASSYEQVVRKCHSKYLYGFTATPKRSDKNERIIYKTIGDIRYQYKDDDNGLDKILKPEFTSFTFSSLEKTTPYSDMLSSLLMDEERNNKIVEDINKAYKEKKNIIVLTDRIEHINLLKSKLENVGNLFIINGQLSINEKKLFFTNVEKAKNGFVIISTGKYIGEGFDEKKLDTLFLVSPFRWNGTLEQYVGRLHRENEGKELVEVHDYVDINVKMFENMYHERLRGYKKLGYSICGDEVIFERKIFSTNDYKTRLLEDIRNIKKEVVLIINDFVDEELTAILNLCSNIKIYTKLDKPIEHKNISSLLESSLGINAIIIDQKILWYGGINPFKTTTYYDSIMRINDKSICETIIKEANKKVAKN